MAIEYAGGTVVKTTIDGFVNTDFMSDLNTAMVSAGWTSQTLAGPEYRLTSATTPQGLNCQVRLTTSGSDVLIATYDLSGNNIGAQQVMLMDTYVYDVIITRYTLWLSIPGLTGPVVRGVATAMCTGVPYLPDPVVPLFVQTATNASPIEITTTSPHGMISGQTVYIVGVEGNTAANGSFVITSTGTSTFTLNGSVGNGAYTTGGIIGNNDRVSRCIYITGLDGEVGITSNGWRTDPFQTTTGNVFSSRSAIVVNGSSFTSLGLNCPLVQPESYPWRNTRSVIVEPYIYTNSATQAQVYGAVVIRGTPVPAIDTMFTMDGHSWMIYGVGGTNSALAVACT